MTIEQARKIVETIEAGREAETEAAWQGYLAALHAAEPGTRELAAVRAAVDRFRFPAYMVAEHARAIETDDDKLLALGGPCPYTRAGIERLEAAAAAAEHEARALNPAASDKPFEELAAGQISAERRAEAAKALLRLPRIGR
jgi:hypothetical protein